MSETGNTGQMSNKEIHREIDALEKYKQDIKGRPPLPSDAAMLEKVTGRVDVLYETLARRGEQLPRLSHMFRMND